MSKNKILDMRIVYLGLVLGMLFAVTMSFGQITSAPRIVPPTPNVASLGKYSDISFGLFTGQPNISFPLYEISYPDYSFPISLSYSYNGLKVEEYPSWVGAGWTLQATGVITRQTRGLPDERINGYNGQAKRGLQVVSFILSGANKSNSAYYSFLQDIKNGRVDTEPDIFVLSAPGLSGKFFFDETQCNSQLFEGTMVIKNAVLLAGSKLKVRGFFDYNATYGAILGMIRKFEVTDERGVVFLFDKIEKAEALKYDLDNTTPTLDDYGNAWYLSQITTPNGNTITFQYGNRVLDNPATLYEEMLIPDDFHTSPKYHVTSTIESILQSITFRNGSVTFMQSPTPREDWNSQTWFYSKNQAIEQPKALQMITVTEGNSTVKQVTFQYTPNSPRLQLASFQEKDGTTAKPPYVFEYEPGYIPQIGVHSHIFQQDHWGYYTGTSYQTLLTPFFATGTENGTNAVLSISLSGNPRIPVPSASKVGLLNKITYPSGGYTQFVYEPNDFYSSSPIWFVPPKEQTTFGSPSARTGLGIGQVEDIKSFTLARKTFGMINFTTQLSNCGEASAYVYLRRQPSLEIVASLTKNRLGGQENTYSIGPGTGEMLTLAAGTYDIVAGASIESTCQVPITQRSSASIEFIGYTGDNYVAGGFRVKQMSDCAGTNCITKNFEYKMPGTSNSSGILNNSPSYGRDVLIRTRTQGGGALENLRGVYLYSSSIIPIATENGGPMGYKYVTVTTDNTNGTINGKKVHQFTAGDDTPDVIFFNYPVKPRIDNGHKRGMELMNQNYDKQGTLLSQDTKFYSMAVPYLRTLGLSVGPVIINADNAQPNFSLNAVDSWLMWAEVMDRDYVPYDYCSNMNQLASETSSNYAGGIAESTVQTHFYENPTHQLVTRSEMASSDGKVLITKLSYADDVTSLTGYTPSEIQGIQSMKNRMAPIEKKTYRDGQLVSTIRNYYNGANLSKSAQAMGTANMDDIFTVDSYDVYGNILQYHTNKATTSYVYGYNNTKPIAEVTNATLSEVFHTSFEAGEEGGNVYDDARTGSRSRTGGYSRSMNGLVVGKKYILTYWKKVGTSWQLQSTNFIAPASQTIAITIPVEYQVDEIRFAPADAFISTFTYKQGVGVSTVNDTNNKVSYYEYDDMNRLKLIKDDQGQILKTFQYNYKK